MIQPASPKYNEKALYLLNHASVTEIDHIPGMTTKIAEDVHAFCQTQGVTDWEQLEQINGISSQRLASLKTHFVAEAADIIATETAQSEKGKVVTSIERLWNSPAVRIIGAVSTVLLIFISIIEGLASWQDARDVIFGTPTPTPPECFIKSDNGSALVPIFKNGLDDFTYGFYGAIYPSPDLHWVPNGTEVHLIREISGTTKGGTLLQGQTFVTRHELEAIYSANPKVVWVQPDSAADKAGFSSGDEILSVNGQNIEDMTMFLDAIDDNRGIEMEVTVRRNYATDQGVIVGMSYENEDEDQGVLVTDLLTDGPADQAGIEVGDRILAIDGKQVSEDSIRQTLKAYVPGDVVNVSIYRNQASLSVPLSLTSPSFETTLTVVPYETPLDYDQIPIQIGEYFYDMQDKGLLGLYLDDKIISPVRGFVDSSDIVCNLP